MDTNNTIIMTDKDRERWIPILQEYYRGKGIDEKDIQAIADKVFIEAQLGWVRCPKDLDTRIKIKTGYQWKSHENLNPNGYKAEEADGTASEEQNDKKSDLLSNLSSSEKQWWGEREDSYRKDFDFNDSSDFTLLNQLLVEEVIQRRIFIKQLKERDRDYSKQLTDILKRIGELQERLGITRQQRAGILDNIDGNVAQLALALNQKLEAMPEALKKEYEEELYYTNLKNQRPPNNMLPPVEKIEALLRIDGEIKTNFTGDQISVITEEVAKQISEVKKPAMSDLADGVEI